MIPRRSRSAAGVAAILLVATAITVCAAQARAAGPLTPAGAILPTAAQVAGVVHVCSSCHGLGGRSISPLFPRLAGQKRDYIEAQLKAFRDRKRADRPARAYMWGMAARLTDPMIKAIADYYATRPLVPGRQEPASATATGRKIYDGGMPSKGVPPCAACHGARAEGKGTIPRLASEHRRTIEHELRAFAAGTRVSDMMHQISKPLTPDQIRDLAAYLRTL
jgi:cytochrome c553